MSAPESSHPLPSDPEASSLASTATPDAPDAGSASPTGSSKDFTSIRDLISVSGQAHDGVVPLLTELADKHQQSSVLLQKAALLLGLADKFKDTDRGTQLRADAEEFISYAKELQSSDEAALVLEKAQLFADNVADKYERHGRGLFNQSQELWDEIVSSGEAREFLGVGTDIINDWKAYGGSAEGQELIAALSSQVSSLVENKGSSLLDLVKDYSDDATLFLANARRHKETLEEAAKDVNQIIEEDDELKGWLEQGKQYVAEKYRSQAENPDALDGQAEATLSDLSQKGQTALAEFKNSDMGKDLLKRGTEVLQGLQGNADLRPDSLVSHAKKLKDDPQARQELATKVKDAALDFLLQYLPTVKVPPLEQDDDSSTMYLGNIDLSGFKLLSKDVDVVLTDAGVNIIAKNIKCDMKGLEWKYKSKSFPYMGASGKADALAEGITLQLHFEVERFLREDEDEDEDDEDDDHAPAPATAVVPAAGAEGEAEGEVEGTIDEIFKYDYALVLLRSRKRRFVTMPSLAVTITDTWLSSLMNTMLSWFSSEVRVYVEDQLNVTIEAKSGVLLTMINNYAQEYLPLFAQIKDKVKEKAPKFAAVVKKTTTALSADMERARAEAAAEAAKKGAAPAVTDESAGKQA